MREGHRLRADSIQLCGFIPMLGQNGEHTLALDPDGLVSLRAPRGLRPAPPLLRRVKAAGIQHLRFQDLRHSFGTLAVQVFPLSDVRAYMGHADIATTMIYVRPVPQHAAAAMLTAAVAQTAARGGLGVNPDRLDAADR
jgi:integrase